MMDRKHMMCIEMTTAIQEKNFLAVSRLLDKEKFDVDSELMLQKYPIMMSIESNAIAIGKFLITHGCSLSLKNMQGLTPLLIAVQLLNFDFVKLLLDNRADLTSQDNGGRTALHLAAQMNSLRMVQLLMKNASASVIETLDKEGKTPFMYACAHGSKSMISYFLEKGGCDMNRACGPYQDTPLLTVISNYNCSTDIVNKFLDAGANINHLNKVSETPLLKAFHALELKNTKSFPDICSLLIERGSRVNVQNSLGDTPLHIAVLINEEPLVRKLLNAGSSINATNNLGLTPLFYACRKGFEDIASLLLDCGANTKAMNYLSHNYQWRLNNESLLYPNTSSVFKYVFKKSKECRDLRSSCRLVIRKHLSGSLEHSASLLPLPPSLVKFILLC